ncbi:unnamed protein product [Bursaphelenchus xylophilus]|uniref:(pine wood nematode) hypothetical protein n=1 Tax=Bursaphelenchus xylophilus TaxID=6326 RepID=A0A1I7SML3_BURXY|nr:unnamed protein product [Bursaphelenchus xylophilus]CAG9130272.1 unnamed protein product [Bursaphelenchus xylophilus]
MKYFRVGWLPLILLLISRVFYDRLAYSTESLRFLNEASQDFGYQDFETAVYLHEVLERVQSPAVVLLNKHALNVTLNFLCNLRQFHVTSRVLVFAFDFHSYTVIKSSFPAAHVIHWKMLALQDPFTAGDGRYQLFQYFRARLSSYLTTKTSDFWMIQADTIWKKNLFESVEYNKTDLLFDQEGESGLLSDMIAGGYFHVKSNEKTFKFFKNIGDTLLDYYVTDNNLMTRQCYLRKFGVKCDFIPYNVIANWRYDPSDELEEPAFIQFDGGEGAEEKFIKMKKTGALFVDSESLSADPRLARCLASPDVDPKKKIKDKKAINKANIVIRSAHQTTELLCLLIPQLRTFFLGYLFPFYAYFLAI